MPSHYELRQKAKRHEEQEDKARRERGLRGSKGKGKKPFVKRSRVNPMAARNTLEGAMTMATDAASAAVGTVVGRSDDEKDGSPEIEEWDDEYVQVLLPLLTTLA